ncbi:MAG: hypothetical protein DI630_33060 [Gordonia sp. (in: high G+C Gram-positive bacteria)]|nr:MAG: hypothetical protein DI630_33060 [Gordonia sp. (in: high G+C Gram-positive bacteria)]
MYGITIISSRLRSRSHLDENKGFWSIIDQEREDLEGSLQTYLNKGRKAVPGAAKKPLVPETTAEDREIIRDWARKQGFEFAERGRIPKKIFRAYREAHDGKLPGEE